MTTPATATSRLARLPGFADNVNAVCEPLPVNVLAYAVPYVTSAPSPPASILVTFTPAASHPRILFADGAGSTPEAP
ncbi:MAG: hypothetical protein ACK55I_15250, partial [bacterium]